MSKSTTATKAVTVTSPLVESWWKRSAPMIYFIGRRLMQSLVVLLGATFIVYMLLAVAIDPLEELYSSTAPNKEQLIIARRNLLDLDTPAPLRYLKWLGGIGGCVVGHCNLGTSFRTGRPVIDILSAAIPQTVQLIGMSIVIAILLGVTVGIVSALRQYSGFDYTVTFFSFLMYSLPSFWVAVLLKQWGAIGFNNFFADPRVSLPSNFLISLVGGLVIQAVVAGDLRKRLITAGATFAITFGFLFFISQTLWLKDPSLGPVAIGVLGAVAGVGVVALLAGLKNRKALYSTFTTVAVGVVLWFPLQPLFSYATGGLILGLLAIAIVVGLLVGYLWGGADRGQSMRTSAITAVIVSILVFFDRTMQTWKNYTSSSQINNRPVATIGSVTPGLQGSYWAHIIDLGMHLALPTVALILISFASYTRYSRASLLEVMNQDYIRTARAKGLSERVVVVRHAFRNALIPLATIIPLDFASLFGGAIITERIFSWTGMGTLFIKSLQSADAAPLMGYFIVVASLLVVANVVVDFLYAALDPRIRVIS